MRATTYAVRMLFLSALSIGCSSSTDTSSNGAVFSGVYDAQAINGSPLPLVLQSTSTSKLTGVAGVVTARSGGRFGITYTYHLERGAVNAVVTDAAAGSYSLDGSNVTFVVDSAKTKTALPYVVHGTVTGGTMTLQGMPIGQSVTVTLVRR